MSDEANHSRAVAQAKCTACGASLRPDSTRCWLCGRPVTPAEPGEDRFSGPAPQAPPKAPSHNFSLATLMLYVTLFCVICGVISIAPGVGIALGLLMVPVAAQTAIMARRKEELGVSLETGEKITLFLGSLGIVALAGVAAAIAFCITCFVGGWGGVFVFGSIGPGEFTGIGLGIATGFLLGTIAGLYVGYRALRALLRAKGIIELSRRSKTVMVIGILIAGAAAIALYITLTFGNWW